MHTSPITRCAERLGYGPSVRSPHVDTDSVGALQLPENLLERRIGTPPCHSQRCGESTRGIDRNSVARDVRGTNRHDPRRQTISQPTLVKLLEDGIVPHERVSTRRTVLLADVLAYRDPRRAAAEPGIPRPAVGRSGTRMRRPGALRGTRRRVLGSAGSCLMVAIERGNRNVRQRSQLRVDQG